MDVNPCSVSRGMTHVEVLNALFAWRANEQQNEIALLVVTPGGLLQANIMQEEAEIERLKASGKVFYYC